MSKASIILPTYITKQPSTGKEVKFRPFTVKEEKALLLALQEEDITTVTTAIKNTVGVCTSWELDPETTPYYDVEYVFLKIRSKSVGEILDLIGSCECSPTAKTPFSVDIGDTVVKPSPVENINIKIPDTTYTVIARHPSISDFASLAQTNGESATQVVANCITSVFTDDEVMSWDSTEKMEFVESMSPKQQKELAQFLKNMPMTSIPTKYKCKACGKEHVGSLSGFENFFV